MDISKDAVDPLINSADPCTDSIAASLEKNITLSEEQKYIAECRDLQLSLSKYIQPGGEGSTNSKDVNRCMFSPTDGVVLSRPMQKKINSLTNCQLETKQGREKLARNLKSLGERYIMELILKHQSPKNLNRVLWGAVRERGCQFLGPAMQEEILRYILLAMVTGSSLSRKTLVAFVLQRVSGKYHQASKTAIGHVVQLLYRASCFEVIKRDDESSLMQLKVDFRTYDPLRLEHDKQIIQIAQEAGLRITPGQWSSLLYGDVAHKKTMQSLIDKLQKAQSFDLAISELVKALQRANDPANLLPLESLLKEIYLLTRSEEFSLQSAAKCLNNTAVLLDAFIKFVINFPNGPPQVLLQTHQPKKGHGPAYLHRSKSSEAIDEFEDFDTDSDESDMSEVVSRGPDSEPDDPSENPPTSFQSELFTPNSTTENHPISNNRSEVNPSRMTSSGGIRTRQEAQSARVHMPRPPMMMYAPVKVPNQMPSGRCFPGSVPMNEALKMPQHLGQHMLQGHRCNTTPSYQTPVLRSPHNTEWKLGERGNDIPSLDSLSISSPAVTWVDTMSRLHEGSPLTSPTHSLLISPVDHGYTQKVSSGSRYYHHHPNSHVYPPHNAAATRAVSSRVVGSRSGPDVLRNFQTNFQQHGYQNYQQPPGFLPAAQRSQNKSSDNPNGSQVSGISGPVTSHRPLSSTGPW